VLWLLADNQHAAANLRREAVARGVAAERLIFAGRTSNEEHLARHRLADLFLDTLPCNAHTTASDSLWSGVPIVTCAGRSFPARVAGSLLSAVGLKQLITQSLEEYEALALALARDRGRMRALRAHLADDRERLPLFDTPRFCRHLEQAYRHMWRTYLDGKPATTFHVASIETGSPRL
jgi:predicted O-linked N-acetylglucosamine transferase (SPINDLY family)